MSEAWPRKIEQHGFSYWLLEPLAAQRARIRFEGSFEGRPATWDATLLALGELSDSTERRGYLDIGEPETAARPIEIGLEVAAVDEAVILRTILMVRQYRRLRRGRWRFGELLF